ncbi:MAG: photosystem I reaction center subunit XI [Cyanobacteria bacterium CRU_2_1]|nr:photosystem I reaction center subunit XI [Cyanobacteria bacterium RU_5_0]NJR61196.1 photosystem I reaction center subunit XI [Cyanobacteria bacterium CRU_2_1]
MSSHTNGGSPIAYPQRYDTIPTAILSQVEQQDRWLKSSESKVLSNFFSSGAKRLEIVATLTQNANAIVSAAADRIFHNGSPMVYLEQPPNRENLPGYTVPPRKAAVRRQETLKLQTPSYGNPLRGLSEFLKTQLSDDRDPLPGGFRSINIARYGSVRMKRSMRDLAWFLRYVTYAIASGDSSILIVNVQGLRGVIPEDVTEATVVSMREMRWRSLQYFKKDAEAIAIIQEPFDAMITAYLAEKPPIRLRQGISNDQQGLVLPESYAIAASVRPKFVMKPHLAETEKQAVIKAAYRQVFERDVTREYGVSLAELESKFRSGEFSTKEFIRQLGKSRLYRDLFYAPFVISRVIELATRHFLGRGLSSPEEFQGYFEVISKGGLPALLDTLVDSQEYSDYFGEETVPYLRGLGLEAQECRNWGAQFNLFKFSAPVHKVPQFVTLFGEYQKPLPNQHPYGAGNDPLEIQFGAIFPHKDRDSDDHPAFFDRDSRRILISCEPSNGNGSHNEVTWGKVPGSLEHRILRLNSPVRSGGSGEKSSQGVSVNLLRYSPDAVVLGVYRQIFGREVFTDQRLTMTEVKVKSGEITVREFIRQLAKSPLFRGMYWDSLYVTKAIEYIHRRLLGRPTYGRQEMGRYYDLCARQGFYALIDAIIDSSEYIETFGEDTVPYERYVTPRGLEMRVRGHVNGSGNPLDGDRVYEGTWMKAALQRVNLDRRNAQLSFHNGKSGTLGVRVLETIDQHLVQPNSHGAEQAAYAEANPSEPYQTETGVPS